jgi:hypothetical protein
VSSRKSQRPGGGGARSRRREEQRNRRFAISLTPGEYEKLERAAADDDRPVAMFARRLLLKALDELE